MFPGPSCYQVWARPDTGRWQYSLDNGLTWAEVGDADTNHRLLAADDATHLRFIPNPGSAGLLILI